MFAVLSDMLLLLISAQGFPHVKGIFSCFLAGGIVAVVIEYTPENTITTM